MNRFISRILGGSQPNDDVDFYLADVRNDAAKAMSMTVSVCLTPQIDEGTRLSFTLSPLLRNSGGEGSSWNLLGHVRNSLNLENGDRVVIMHIERMHTHNELNGDLHFFMEHPFDNDADTQVIRNRIDSLLATDDKETTIVPSSAATKDTKMVYAAPRGGRQGEKGKEEQSDFEEDPGVKALFDVSAPSPSVVMDETTANQADAMTIRGSRIYRNKAEINNVIDLGLVKANVTVWSVDPETGDGDTVYRASVSNNIVKWFAGQDRFVVENPCQVLTRANTEDKDLETRAKRPVINYLVYPEEHSLILFINMFEEDLEVQPHEKRLLKTDRDTGLGSGTGKGGRLYQVDKSLVDRAREMILYVVYAQMYYTTLRDCRLVRQIESEEQEFALLHRLASDWGLAVHPQTKHVSDWAPGQYRPQVVVTLRVTYFLIHSVSNSAAALHKERVLLSVK